MYQNFCSLIKLSPLILVLITSCVLDIEIPIEELLSIEWISIDYDQAENKLFLQLEILPENEIINDVFVEISSDNFDSIDSPSIAPNMDPTVAPYPLPYLNVQQIINNLYEQKHLLMYHKNQIFDF